MKFLIKFISLLVCVLNQDAFSQSPSVNLRISDDETYNRPNAWSMNENSINRDILYGEYFKPSSRAGISIAWRNANQIEEVEVRVQNLGEGPGEGRLFVEVIDEYGKVLLHLEPPEEMKIVRIPAKDQGGKEGKIIRMKASWELNALIDRFDLTRTRYGVRATIETIGPESDWLDNSKVKEWNIPFKVTPGHLNVYNYTFKNNSLEVKRVRWFFEHSELPAGWRIQGVPKKKGSFTIEPNEEISGYLLLKAPSSIVEGSFLEARISLVDEETNRIFQQHEWFQVYDTEKPDVSNYRAIVLPDNTIAIQALVADKGSGVLEATGVTTQYSVDGGKTWAVKAHNYKVGNFVRPTLFETVIGPFTKGTQVLIRLTAKDTGGNAQTMIPIDASIFSAPKNSELLLQQAYIFPRTRQNPIFDLERLKELQVTLDTLKSLNVDIKDIDFTKPNPLGIEPTKILELNLDKQRIEDIKEDLGVLAKLDIDFNKIKPLALKKANLPGEKLLGVSTIEITIK